MVQEDIERSSEANKRAQPNQWAPWPSCGGNHGFWSAPWPDYGGPLSWSLLVFFAII